MNGLAVTLAGFDMLQFQVRALEFIMTALELVLLFVVGYILGYFVFSRILKRVLLLEQIQLQLVKFGATTTSMWKSIVEFAAQYTTWFVVFFALTIAGDSIPQLDVFFSGFILPLTILIVLIIVGLLIGGLLGKLTKDTLLTIGLEQGLKKYKIAESVGGAPISSILSTIVKWYAFLLFLAVAIQMATQQLLLDSILNTTMQSILAYVPNVILGVLVLFASLVIGDFAAMRIRERGLGFGDLLSVAVEIVIIFFGVVLALPRLFGIDDPAVFQTSLSVMTQSFQILMIGIALGLAIAIGFGLKDYMAKMVGDLKK